MSELIIINKKIKPKPSIVYNTYWQFAAERQNIFFKRFEKSLFPWTNDEILDNYKFTNAYRASDRTSQYLIRNVIYKGDQSPEEVFFRILLFKIFNKIETWEFLESELYTISWKNYSFDTYNNLLFELLENNIAIYSAAYIMASGKTAFNYPKKHQNHLKLIEKMMSDKAVEKLAQTKNMEEGYLLLKNYPSIGEFLAYQYITDINYSEITNYSELEFVKAGPGAKDGITKCFLSFGEYQFEDIIKMMTDNQEKEFKSLDLNFKNLWGRNLQLIDIQNIFCEVDKYSRIFHPEIVGISNRTRIKQKFVLKEKVSINYFFPPKWGLNDLI